MLDQEEVMSDEIITSDQLDTVRSEEGVTSAEEKLSVTSQGSIDDPLADELPSLEQSVIGEEQLESKDPRDETKLINTDDNPIETQVVSGDLGSSEESTGTSADQPEKIAVSLVEPVVEGSEEVVNPVDGLVSDDAEKTVANATSVEDLSETNADQPEKVAVSLDEAVVEASEEVVNPVGELPSLEQSVIGEEQLESKDPGDETKLINTDHNPIEAQVVSGDLGSSEESTGTSADQPEKIAVSLVEPVVEASEEVVNPVDGLVSDDAEKTVANATSVEDLSETNADQPEKVAVSLDEPVVEAFEGAVLERFTQLSGVAEFTESELSLILRAALSALSDALTDIKSVSDNGDGSVDNDGLDSAQADTLLEDDQLESASSIEERIQPEESSEELDVGKTSEISGLHEGLDLLAMPSVDLRDAVFSRLGASRSSSGDLDSSSEMRELAMYTTAFKVQSALLKANSTNDIATSVEDYQQLGFTQVNDKNKGFIDALLLDASAQNVAISDLAERFTAGIEQFDRLLGLSSGSEYVTRSSVIVDNALSMQLDTVAEQWDVLFGDSTYDDTLVDFLSQHLQDQGDYSTLVSIDLADDSLGQLTSIELPSSLMTFVTSGDAVRIEGRDSSGNWQALPEPSISITEEIGLISVSPSGDYYTGFRIVLSDTIPTEVRQQLVGESIVFATQVVDSSLFERALDGLEHIDSLEALTAARLIGWSGADNWSSFQALDQLVPTITSLSDEYIKFYGGEPDSLLQQSILRLAVPLSLETEEASILLPNIGAPSPADLKMLTGIELASDAAVGEFLATLKLSSDSSSSIEDVVGRLYENAWLSESERLLLESFDALAVRVLNLQREDMNAPEFLKEAERLGSVIRLKQLIDSENNEGQIDKIQSSDFEHFGAAPPRELALFSDYLMANKVALLSGTQSLRDTIASFETDLTKAQLALSSLFNESVLVTQEISVSRDESLDSLMTLASNQFGDDQAILNDLISAILDAVSQRQHLLGRIDLTVDTPDYFALLNESGDRLLSLDGILVHGIKDGSEDDASLLTLDAVPGQPGLWSLPSETELYTHLEVVASGSVPEVLDTATIQMYGRNNELTPEYLSLLGYEGYSSADIPLLYKMASIAEQYSESLSVEEFLDTFERIKPLLSLQNQTIHENSQTQLSALWQWADSSEMDFSGGLPWSNIANLGDDLLKGFPDNVYQRPDWTEQEASDELTELSPIRVASENGIGDDDHNDVMSEVFIDEQLSLVDADTGETIWGSPSSDVSLIAETQNESSNSDNTENTDSVDRDLSETDVMHMHRDWADLLDQLQQQDIFS